MQCCLMRLLSLDKIWVDGWGKIIARLLFPRNKKLHIKFPLTQHNPHRFRRHVEGVLERLADRVVSIDRDGTQVEDRHCNKKRTNRFRLVNDKIYGFP